MTVDIQVRTLLARFVIALAVAFRSVIGLARARRLATWAAADLTRYRVARGPWQKFGPEMREYLVQCWASHWEGEDAK